AEAQAKLWRSLGHEHVNVWKDWRGRFRAYSQWSEEFIATPANTTMPRNQTSQYRNPRTGNMLIDLAVRRLAGRGGLAEGEPLPEALRKKLERLRLFSVPTRHYLRRRGWRYFRKLGRQHPERYVPAVSQALLRYTDDDVADGLALLDNW